MHNNDNFNNNNTTTKMSTTKRIKVSESAATQTSVTTVPTILRIKIKLIGSKPPIWRTILCNADTTLKEFHRVIQITIGWWDSHLHQFEVEGQKIGNRDDGCDYMEDERRFTLKDVAPNGRFGYEYDFGDCWEHDIHIEKEVPYDTKLSYPLCVAGKRNCPPEDCGGIGNYENILDEIADGTIDEDMKEWMEQITGGEPFNPEQFDLATINEKLQNSAP